MHSLHPSAFLSRYSFQSTIFPVSLFLRASVFLMVSGDVGKPEKEELNRALEDLRRQVPEYTGYLLVDVVVEIFKMFFIFLLRLLGQQQQRQAPITE